MSSDRSGSVSTIRASPARNAPPRPRFQVRGGIEQADLIVEFPTVTCRNRAGGHVPPSRTMTADAKCPPAERFSVDRRTAWSSRPVPTPPERDLGGRTESFGRRTAGDTSTLRRLSWEAQGGTSSGVVLIVLNVHMICAHLTPGAQIRTHGQNLSTTSSHVNTSVCIRVHPRSLSCTRSCSVTRPPA